MGYVRVPAGASDFSLSHYTYDDTCCDLFDFSIAPDEAHRIPVLLQAKQVNPGLKLMGSPWSAPAWMKTTDSLYRGTLKPQHYGDYAAYLARYVDAWAGSRPSDRQPHPRERASAQARRLSRNVADGERRGESRQAAGPRFRRQGR
jgi:glucosylceramidase